MDASMMARMKFISTIDRSLQQMIRLLQINLCERCSLPDLLKHDPPTTESAAPLAALRVA